MSSSVSSRYRTATLALSFCLLLSSAPADAVLVSAVLPTSRSAEVNQPVTVFATLLNASSVAAANCRPVLTTALDVALSYQTTDSATNSPTGSANTPATLAPNSGQSWLISLNPGTTLPPTELPIDFSCNDLDSPSIVDGVNTVLLSASNSPTADIIALSATTSEDGIVATTAGQAAAFSVASVNVGAGAPITVSPRVLGEEVDSLSICQTNPINGQCLAQPSASVELQIESAATPTFSIFILSDSEVAFAPGLNRVAVDFTDAGVRRGSTSVALQIIPQPTSPSAPNLLLIISDDQGLDASAQYPLSNDLPTTPNMNALANAGLTFENAWATPSCTTTRATMLTGQFGVNSGIDSTPGRIQPGTSILQSTVGATTDYATAVFGKWHVGGGNVEASHPNDLGVGHFAGNVQGNIDDYFSWDLTVNGNTSVSTNYHTTEITDQASSWIAAQSSPWFAWVAYSAPHSPYHLPPTTLQSSGLPGGDTDISNNSRAYYLAAIEALDTEVGRLLGEMPESIRENTLIIFIGDNGTPRNVIDQSVYQRSHGKSSLYQGGVSVPLLVSGVGVTRAGERETALVTSTDIYATVLELAGSSSASPEDSQSFAATLAAANSGVRNYSYAEIQGEHENGWTVRNATHKFITFDDGSELLFNLSSDTDEQKNLLPGDGSTQTLRDELRAFGLMVRGETNTSTGSRLDITDALLTNRSANCSDYVAGYRADALDANNNMLFEGDLVISVVDNKCVFSTNLIPNHTFNDGASSFPNPVAAQAETYSITASPVAASAPTGLTLSFDNAVLLNGAKVDLLAAGCFGVGDGRVGCGNTTQPWRYDPLAPDSGFQVDTHNAHTQSNGSYHYHGPPNALFSNTAESVSPVVGFAADGFPIYGSFILDPEAPTGSASVREVQSSYQLKSGDRPDGAGDPGGSYDGTFRDDYEYVEGSGDLDECNGRTEDGVYGYYITQRFPYVLGCFTGSPDGSFAN